MSETRATNGPSGAKLLNESKANPASVNMDIFAKKSAAGGGATGQGTVNDNYLRETREQNPDPTEEQKEKPQVSLAKCVFVTTVEELKLNEKFEFSVEVKKIGQPKSLKATFDLYATRKRDGKDERDKIWSGKEGTPVDPKADPIVLKGSDVLATQADYQLGESVKFELEAVHPEAEQSAKSDPVELKLVANATWLGGDDLFFRTNGELPLLKDDGSLIQVLAQAIKRIEEPPSAEGETVICFGYASASENGTEKRKLSLRRAQAVKAILDRDEVTWKALAKQNFETQDVQQFLSDLHSACGWECEPGAVDGKDGPKTKAAVKSFQRECNKRYGTKLMEDGAMGPLTWVGALRTIHGQIQDALEQDSKKAPEWKKPKWGHDGKGIYANGDDFATQGDKPEERSVQITFFAPGSEPVLVDAPEGNPTSPENNPVHDPKKFEKKKADAAPVAKPTPSAATAGSGSEAIIYSDSGLTLAEAHRIQMALNPPPQKMNSSGKFVDATSAESLDALDPTKHAAADNLYQFLDLSSPAGISEADLDKYLAGKGVLAGHAKLFIEASKAAGISEVYAAVHACLETGNGTSALATGKLEVEGVATYNMFGIGALDGKAEKTGSQKAYDLGWTSVELAIEGGIKWIAKQYICNATYKQNTLYKMRWNPAKPGQHQYATAYNWATGQIQRIKKMYAEFPNAKKVFDVSRYKDQASWTVGGVAPTTAATSAPAAVKPAEAEEETNMCSDACEKWMAIAKGEIGQTEIDGGKNNPRIVEYHASTTLNSKTDEVPWCAAFVNWVVTEARIAGTNSARALDWARWGEKLSKPIYGAIGVIDWHKDGTGHVGFVVGENDAGAIVLLGGNQGKKGTGSVNTSTFQKSNFTAYVWPKGFDKSGDLPKIAGTGKDLDFDETR